MGLGPFGPLSGIECSLYLGPSAPFGLVMGPSGLYEPLANDACLPMVMLKCRQLSSKQAKHASSLLASSESSQRGKEDPPHQHKRRVGSQPSAHEGRIGPAAEQRRPATSALAPQFRGVQLVRPGAARAHGLSLIMASSWRAACA